MDPTQIPLRGLHLPDAVGWWPLAPGWWVLIALAALGLAWLLRAVWRRRARNAARRHALRQLEHCRAAWAEDGNAIALGTSVSALLRRTMLAYAPRAEVAGLTGEAWLNWLDRNLGEPVFSSGPGRALIELPYRNPETAGDDIDVDALLGVVRERLQTPPGGRG